MLDFRAHRQAILTAGNESTTGEALAKRVDELARHYRARLEGLAVLRADSTVSFVAAFLALLEAKRPVAVTSAAWTKAETDQNLTVLGEFTPLDPTGEIGQKMKLGQANLHPDAAVVLFTSGSTGQPRAVQLSRRNIESNMQAVIASLDFARAREQILFLPLSYSFGLLGQLMPGLHLGLRTTLLEGFGAVPRWVAEHGLSGMWSGVPSHWTALLRFLKSQSGLHVDPSHIISAGGRLDVEVRRQMRENFPRARLFNNYGLTEASPRILCLRGDSPLFLSEAVGYPVGDWRLQVSPEGELLAQGSQIMLGYMHGAESARVQNGWLHTGDLGEAAADGCIYLKGRADHLVKVAGERISLSEVESVLSHLEGVRAACVLTRPHPVNGNALEAFLECDSGLALAALSGEVKRQLSAHKVPQAYFRIEALPLNANGKVDRRKLESLRASAERIE